MSYRAVIFDLYDTLLYSIPTGTREQAIARVAASGVTQEQWRKAWAISFELADRGKFGNLENRIRHVLQQVGITQPEEPFFRELVGLLQERERYSLYPDVVSSLHALRSRGYRIGLISNITSDERHCVDSFALPELFEAMVLSCDEGCAKPEPQLYQLAATRLGVDPLACVFVDDRMQFVQAAQNLGMTGVLIDRPESRNYGREVGECDLRIENLFTLLRWLPEQAGA